MRLTGTFFTYIFLSLLAYTISAQESTGKIKQDVFCSDCYYGQVPTKIPRPEFPEAAKLVHASGRVDVKILIGEKGDVLEADAVSGNLLLRPAAVKAALKAKFKPITFGNQPVKFVGIITYNFVADSQALIGSIETGSQKRSSSKTESILVEEEPSVIIKGQAINLPKPPFPNCDCRFSSKINKVLVEVEIDVNGNAVSANAITGHPALRNGSVAAARFSKFSQTKVAGVPVRAKALITYNYILDDEITVNVIVNSIEALQ